MEKIKYILIILLMGLYPIFTMAQSPIIIEGVEDFPDPIEVNEDFGFDVMLTNQGNSTYRGKVEVNVSIANTIIAREEFLVNMKPGTSTIVELDNVKVTSGIAHKGVNIVIIWPAVKDKGRFLNGEGFSLKTKINSGNKKNN